MWPRLRQAAVIAVLLLASILLSQDTATSSGGPVTAPTTQAHRHAGAATVKTVGAAHPQPFTFGPLLRLPKAAANLGFAGFRVHYPLHSPGYKDELIVFLGASYFRVLGRNQHYGASVRALAIDTAAPGGEEFPSFTDFW